MAQQTVIAYFDSRADAEKAQEALASAGIAETSIRLMPESGSTGSFQRTSTAASYDHQKDEGGFVQELRSLSLPDEDRHAYAEGFSRGGVALAMTADESQIDSIYAIAERHGAVDMDEREASWREEGWTGFQGTVQSTGSGTATDLGGQEVIPVVEEQIRVGKRQVSGGRVRIRSYVVETPVQEQVSLRREHVQIERRPVDRPLSAADDPAFRERVIEAEEHAEEAVVSKEARIKEEIAVRRDAVERTETVSDTVRRTEVEVEDERMSVERQGSGPRRDRT